MDDSQSLDCSEAFLVILIALDLRGDVSQQGQLDKIVSRATFDWSTLLKLLLRHRVLVPFCDKIKESGLWDRIPVGDRSAFDEKLSQARLRQLSGVGELIRISRVLNTAEIEFLCLKGPVLSQLLYEDPVTRHYSDLDLLVRREDVSKAVAVLLEIGFKLSDLSDIQTRIASDPMWRYFYHVHLVRGNFPLELHWRLSRNDDLCSTSLEQLFAGKQAIALAGSTLYTLGPRHLRNYTALHGASHCWNRLKWLYDGKLLLRDSPVGSAEGSEIRLMAALLRTLKGGSKEGASEIEPQSSRLSLVVSLCLMQLLSSKECPGNLGNMLRRSFVLLTLHRGIQGKFRYLPSLLVWPSAYETIRLPAALSFLYLFLGPVLWACLQLKLLAGGKRTK